MQIGVRYKIQYLWDHREIKVRLVVKEYIQTYGIDYQETPTLVVKMNTVQVLLFVATNFD